MRTIGYAALTLSGVFLGVSLSAGIEAISDSRPLHEAKSSTAPACSCPQPTQPTDTNSEDDYWPDAMAPVAWPRIVWPETIRERMMK